MGSCTYYGRFWTFFAICELYYVEKQLTAYLYYKTFFHRLIGEQELKLHSSFVFIIHSKKAGNHYTVHISSFMCYGHTFWLISLTNAAITQPK